MQTANEIHHMVYEKLDQKLELAIHRNDDLNKTLITISS
jgi:hypothetical protein